MVERSICVLVVFAAVVGIPVTKPAAAAAALDAQRPALDQPFTLGPGESALVGNERVQVTFDRVLSDSRCPRNVQCIQAGEAIVRVQVTVPGRSREQLDVRTTPRDNAVASGGFVLSLEELQPVPLAGRPVKPSEYRATFVVRRR